MSGQNKISDVDQLFNLKAAIENLSGIYNRSTLIQALAKEIDVSERTMYYYMNDPSGIPAQKFIKLCIILQVSPDECLNLGEYAGTIQSVIDKYLNS